MDIYVTGSIAFDYIMRFPGEFKDMLLAENLESISVSFLVDDMTRQRGGVAPNIAYTLALLGESPYLVGTAGQDFYEYRDLLMKAGVNTDKTRIYDDVFTASFFVNTDNRNNQIASFYSGAMSRAAEIRLKDVIEPTSADPLVIVSPNDPVAMENYVQECKELGIRYLYDPSQQVARVDGRVLAEGAEGAYILIMNEYEHAVLCKKTGFRHDDLLKKAEHVIVTRGINGADIYTKSETYHIPVYPTDLIVDPTGVGDSFRSGLLKGLANGWSWELSGLVGSLAAAYVLEQVGPQSHSFTPAEFVARFREVFDDEGALDILLGE